MEIKYRYNDNQYHIVGKVDNQLVIILIDTGSCMSFISSSLINEVYELNQGFTITDFLGKQKEFNKLTEVELIISNELIITTEILVDFHRKDKEILLGIDFLEQFDSFEIRNNELKLVLDDKEIKVPRIRLNPNLMKTKLNH